MSTYALTPARILNSEWIKLRTLRSTWLTLGAGVLTMLGTALVVALTTNDADPRTIEADLAAPESPLQGWLLAQLIIGVLGVLFVSSEYGTGMVRSTFAAVPRRLSVLAAKTAVFGTVALLLMSAATFLAFFAGQAVLDPQFSASLGDDGVLRAVAGTGVYLALVGLLGGAIGWILRSTAASIGVLTGLLLVIPSLVLLLPASVQEAAGRFLPSNAGQALMTTTPDPALLAPAAGLAVLAAWVLATFVAAAVLLHRRDV